MDGAGNFGLVVLAESLCERLRKGAEPSQGAKPHGKENATTSNQMATRRSRNALLTTDTDDRLIASAATIGESTTPRNG